MRNLTLHFTQLYLQKEIAFKVSFFLIFLLPYNYFLRTTKVDNIE